METTGNLPSFKHLNMKHFPDNRSHLFNALESGALLLLSRVNSFHEFSAFGDSFFHFSALHRGMTFFEIFLYVVTPS